MEQMWTAIKYSREALGFMFVPPVLLLFAMASLSLLCALWKQRRLLLERWKPHHWGVLLHALYFFAGIAVGVLRPALSTFQANHQGVLALKILIYTSFASCAFWVWNMKGFRWF